MLQQPIEGEVGEQDNGSHLLLFYPPWTSAIDMSSVAVDLIQLSIKIFFRYVPKKHHFPNHFGLRYSVIQLITTHSFAWPKNDMVKDQIRNLIGYKTWMEDRSEGLRVNRNWPLVDLIAVNPNMSDTTGSMTATSPHSKVKPPPRSFGATPPPSSSGLNPALCSTR